MQYVIHTSKSTLLYEVKADRWLDWSAVYQFTDQKGQPCGKIARKGWRSLWKARYHILDQKNDKQFEISEDNGWIKVLDGLLGEIPILGLFTGYLFNPSYSLNNLAGKTLVQLKKLPSFWGRRFELKKTGNFDSDDGERIMLGFMMMILLERRRG